ncbi:MAG: hypothetical protein AAB657_04635 [Patescibacteria group bacterium]
MLYKCVSGTTEPLEVRESNCDIVVVIGDHVDLSDWAWYMTTMGKKVVIISDTITHPILFVNTDKIENLLPKIKQILWEVKHPAKKIEINSRVKKKEYTTTVSLFFPKYKNDYSMTAFLFHRFLMRGLGLRSLINAFPELKPVPLIVRNVLSSFKSYLYSKVEIITTDKKYVIVVIKCL